MTQATMLQLNVPDMDCASCVRAITAAVQRVAADANVTADLAAKRVVIDGTGAAADFVTAIERAGFSLTVV